MSLDILIREPGGGVRRSGALVLGRGVPVATTAGGLPEIDSLHVGEAQLMPSGGDDTQAIRDALATGRNVRLGPGTFTVTSPIALGAGQAVVGCGPDLTTVNLPDDLSASAVFILGSGTTVGELTVVRLSGSNYPAGIYAASETHIRLRGLRLVGLGYGVQLSGVSRVEITQVEVERAYNTGIWISGGDQVTITGLAIDNSSSTTGLLLSAVEGLRCEGVTVTNGTRGILAQGSALSFAAIRLVACAVGMTISNSNGVEISGVQTTDGRGVSFSIGSSTAVALDGCSVLRGRRAALSVASCTAVTVAGFHSDMNNAVPSSEPHVVVSGSSLVTVTSIHRVNPATPPPMEVDVSAAGGRVVFIQHDFDPARINSGGNFVAL